MENFNEKAYNKFYKETRRGIYNLIYKMIHDAMQAEELTNDVFVKVYQAMPKFDPSKSSLKTWTYNIATNATIDYIRKAKLKTKSMHDAYIDSDSDKPVDMEFTSDEKNPLESLLGDEVNETLAKALKSLPAQQGEILAQYGQGYTYEEIANDLGLPIGTVKGSIHFARIKMKEIFNRPVLA